MSLVTVVLTKTFECVCMYVCVYMCAFVHVYVHKHESVWKPGCPSQLPFSLTYSSEM